MAPYVKVSSSRFQVDLQLSHISILNSTSSRLRQEKQTPLDLRSSSRPKCDSVRKNLSRFLVFESFHWAYANFYAF